MRMQNYLCVLNKRDMTPQGWVWTYGRSQRWELVESTFGTWDDLRRWGAGLDDATITTWPRECGPHMSTGLCGMISWIHEPCDECLPKQYPNGRWSKNLFRLVGGSLVSCKTIQLCCWGRLPNSTRRSMNTWIQKLVVLNINQYFISGLNLRSIE